MYQVRHICHVAGVERGTLGHGDVRQGIREADEATPRRRGADDHGGVLLSLRETFGDGDGIQIPWEVTNYIG